jgi:hypothetical protein
MHSCVYTKLLIVYRVCKCDLQCQKRPTTVSKETYYSVKRECVQVTP